jgi:glutathione transport system substrate-binding protein
VTERLVSVRAKNLSGFYVIPDGSFNFDDVN